ncbi:MAG: diacylglycerol/lipid kinase family protein [Candidatus Aminicenantales bacterium]
MHPKTQVIVNPESNKGRTRRKWAEIKEGLRHIIKEFRYDFTEEPFQATEIARDAIRRGSELIIGVGGDGTMNEIANGFYDNRKIINPATSLGIVPSGTGCDLTKSLNIPPGLRDALKVIKEAPSMKIDVGRVNFTGASGEPMDRFFLNISDFGIGGEVVKKVNERRLQRKASSYVRCLVSAMIQYRARKVRIRIDGKDLPEQEYLMGAVANGRIFGKGMKIAPGARLDDGLFDVVLVKSMKFLEFCRHGWKLINGSHLTHPKIDCVRGRTVEAASVSGEDVLIELDGEQLGRLPATFEIVPGNLLIKGYPTTV